MTDGVYGIGYGNTSGVGGGYLPPKHSEADNKTDEQTNTNANQARKDVDPDDVMRFLANNNYFINPADIKETANVKGASDVDAETEARIAGYMERFEEIYALVEEEFGSELAPTVMDFVMDTLMGMV